MTSAEFIEKNEQADSELALNLLSFQNRASQGQERGSTKNSAKENLSFDLHQRVFDNSVVGVLRTEIAHLKRTSRSRGFQARFQSQLSTSLESRPNSTQPSTEAQSPLGYRQSYFN